MDPIAIIGMACRFPGANGLEEFWELLRNGRHGIGLIPESRWDRESTFDPDPGKPGKINTRHGGFIEGIDLFDNDFFHISAQEARQMDPQQRIMLELTYEAFSDAGLSSIEIDGAETGVFVGVMSNDYLHFQTADNYIRMDRHSGAGAGHCMIANRISHHFNLRGPSMAIDSACSSSLTSIFTACQSLWSNQCSLALAGGVNLILSPTLSVFYTRGGLSAVDGKCRTLSSDASGMGRGEGAGIVLLKRLKDALHDGDNIYAVIRGGAVNHNGRSNGISSPNRWAQQSLLRQAYEHSGVRPRDLDYVELHGTGTVIGDAIEATALGSVLSEHRNQSDPCLVGSVKSNLGHLEGAAGVAGLIKLALCLSHRQLAPSLWYKEPNPYVDFASLPLKVQDHLIDWPTHNRSRFAGINSFGLGGANAHLVLESAPVTDSSDEAIASVKNFMLQFSAHTDDALLQFATRYRDLIEKLDDKQLSSLCRTTLIRPQDHNHRVAFIAQSRSEMIGHLSDFISAKESSNVSIGRYCASPKRKRFFLFPESSAPIGNQLTGFTNIHHCFRETLLECDHAIQEIMVDPIEVRLADLPWHATSPCSRDLPFVHFGIQIALANLWKEAGLAPDAVAGVGIGQIAACVVAGAIDIKGAIARVAAFYKFELSSDGLSSLDESQPFQIDCHTPLGENILPDLQCLAHETGIFPEIPAGHAADFFLQSLDPNQTEFAGFAGVSGSLIAPLDADLFMTQLARLSVRHNVQWKNFLPGQKLMRLPGYPWQRSRFWIEDEQTAGNDGYLSSLQTSLPFETQDNFDSIPAVSEFQNNVPTSDASQVDPAIQPGPHAALAAPTGSGAGSSRVQGLALEQLKLLSETERRALVTAYLKEQVAETLRLSTSDLEDPETLTGLGIDSLTALQLKNRVEADLKMPVSIVKILDGHSIGDLARDLSSQGMPSEAVTTSGPAQPEIAKSSPELEPANALPADISKMTPDEVDQMLLELLSGAAAQQANSINLSHVA